MSLPTLSKLQNQAVNAVKAWYGDVKPEVNSYGDIVKDCEDAPVFYLGGYAGSGKSTITPVIIDMLGIPLEEIAFMAPTAKAAKVMTEKLALYGIHKRATTIHKAIYRPKRSKPEELQVQLDGLIGQRDYCLKNDDGSKEDEARLHELNRTIALVERDLDKAYDINEGPKFSLNSESDVRKCRLVVVDEASMVGSYVAADLRQFGIPVLAIGDPGQLPPVQDVAGLTVGEPDFHLHEIHRQAMDNPIIRLSMQVREGKLLKIGKYGPGVEVTDRLHDTATYDMNREAQIIVGTNKTRWNVTQRTRKMMGFKSTGPEEGEILIVCKNSKDRPELVNGGFAKCMRSVGDLQEGAAHFRLDIRDENDADYSFEVLQALFEEHHMKVKGAATGTKRSVFEARRTCEHVDWGWVITCHKSQGSQWDDVILHDESGVFGDDAIKWLYTGLTRSSDKLTVVM